MPNRLPHWSRVSSLLALVGGLSGCAQDGSVGARPEAVVYGEDDRTDVYAHPDASLRALATTSIVALMNSTDLTEEVDGTFTYDTSFTHGEAYGLCSDQRFVEQPIAAFCSGTLVAPDVIVTAGHCIDSGPDPDEVPNCADTSLVFDYLYTADGELAELEADDVYNCVEVLARENGTLDYAYVRLDRPVVGHSPADLSAGLGATCRSVADGDAVSVLGFGAGLPLKIDDGGNVTDESTDGSYFFHTSLDTFGGNSGSGVFDADGNMVGVLSAGATDYVTRAGEACDEVNVLPESAGQEVIGHVLPTLFAYCNEASDPDADLCALLDTACPDGPDGGGSGGEGSSCSVSASSTGGNSVSLAFLALLGLTLGRRVSRKRGSAE